MTVTGGAIDPYPSLVARYNFDEGSGTAVADASGNGHDGELKGTLDWVEEGHAGGALKFAGASGNYVDLGTSADLQPSSITVSYWIKRTETMNDKENVLLWFKPDNGYNQNGLFITYNGGVSSYVVVDGFNSFFVNEAPDDFLPLNEWTHVAITFDGTTKATAIYKNGEALEIETEGTPESITPTANAKKLGVSGYGDGAQLNAQLDDFRIYAGAMTASQVRALYEGKDIAGVRPVEATTPVGTAPSLPDTVAVDYENGGEGTAEVVWDAIDPSKYAAAGSFSIEGAVAGTPLKAVANVTVAARSEPKLVLRYRFDETEGTAVSDASGRGHDGQVQGTLEWRPDDGHEGGSLAFAGEGGNYVNAGTSEELQPSSITVSYWIKRTESMNDRENVLLWFKPEADYANKGLFITYNGDSSIVMVDGTGAFFVKQKPDDFLPEGEWTHVVATFDSATNAAAIYKNGVAQTIDFDGTPDSITATADVKKIGVSGYGDGAQLRASLDDFRIYSGAMTAEQVRALYEETDGKPIVSLKSVSVRTRTGKAPVLPATVEATYSDGTKGQVAVAWEPIAKEAYAKAGTFTAKGAVEGTELRAEAVVTVTRPAPSPDAPSAPAAAEKPADPKTLEADSAAWKSGADGSVAIALTGEQTGVSLPVEFASRPDVRSLTVSNGQWTLRLPVSALKAAAGSTSGTQTGSTDGSAAGATAGTTTGTTTGSAASGEARIVVRIEPANGPESSGQEGDASWALAGSAYDWKLALRGADGKETVLSALAEPAELALPYDPARGGDGMTLGVYRWNEGAGKWEYAGGTVDRERHLAKIGLSRTGRYAVLSYEKAFGDVPAGHWAADSIRALVARHVANGMEAGRFDPAGGTTRAEFAALLARALGLTAAEGKPLPFGDVAADAWYAKEVAAAYEAGWIQGATTGRFDPNAPVTREQMAVLIVKAYESKQGTAGVGGAPASGEPTGPADLEAVSPWAKDAVARALALGLMQGKGEGRFDPAAGATRAETAQVVYRLLQLLERPE
ncbi:LamG-like jellyroll fold domain-containing protein [Cohnella xylanilytica]|uniref:LamG-like jellyroll fold domain-containing protein n=1 Tax=Cohnella xylanilytica TaxID=557555 RepID=UPI001FE7873E|nr:LamG-like jellyroll fold domain-containing protein [Cohnella xylanilytica]